ncbi:MAG: hypothetical protein ABW167_05255 [Baekduia sp.]
MDPLTPPDGAQYASPVGSPWPKSLIGGDVPPLRWVSATGNESALYVDEAGVLYDVTAAEDGTFNAVVQEVDEEEEFGG